MWPYEAGGHALELEKEKHEMDTKWLKLTVVA